MSKEEIKKELTTEQNDSSEANEDLDTAPVLIKWEIYTLNDDNKDEE